MPSQTQTLRVPESPAEQPEEQRAIQLPPFLYRILPYYSSPSWTEANRWRWFVRNQPIAQICRDTLISNMLSLEWDVVSRDPDTGTKAEIKKAVDYYKELFTYLEGDFDLYLELILQDMYDLPFGWAVEVGRENDDPEGAVMWAEHIDAATLFPTGNPLYPVAQRVPDVPGAQVTFPAHAIERMYLAPRPELRLRGWGMAPPQKIYMAMEMLSKGDQYYWKLLLDTPEAGLLDLGDVNEESAKKWIEGFRDLFQGVDAFKVPVLYGHREQPAQWIPFNRPPNEIAYDKSYIRYAQVVAAGYGIRLSDIGLAELEGEKTLAGVIRGERQSKRTGRAITKSKTENHFNAMLPDELRFVWLDIDDEETQSRGRALVAITSGLKAGLDSGLIDQSEGRAELVASGGFKTDIDPKKIPPKPDPFGGLLGGAGGFGGGKKPPGLNGDEPVPADQGGRGGPGPIETKSAEPEDNPAIQTPDSLLQRMERIIKPGMLALVDEGNDLRMRRLIRAAVKKMVPSTAATLRSLTDEQVRTIWLPEMQALTLGEPSELDSPIVQRDVEDAREALERHLVDDPWWATASILDRKAILDLFVEAYETGMEEAALDILRSLYIEGLVPSATFGPQISFDLTNRGLLRDLERRAADLVTNVNAGNKYFIKRIIVAGVREGMSSPDIARALREGESAERLLEREGFVEDVSDLIQQGLREMSEYRTNSIVNTEIAKSENSGHFEQFKRSGLALKAWEHMGDRGVTEAGNEHPCPICEGNEALGFVELDYLYETVFSSGGVDGTGREYYPPGHPGECHCSIFFNEEELFEKVAAGEYEPWTGGR